MTKNFIEYNLKYSHFVFEWGNITFHFSSLLHLNKFKDTYLEEINQINLSLSKRFGFHVDFPIIGLLKTYKKIETRGFYIVKDGEVYSCLNHLILNGENLTKYY